MKNYVAIEKKKLKRRRQNGNYGIAAFALALLLVKERHFSMFVESTEYSCFGKLSAIRFTIKNSIFNSCFLITNFFILFFLICI